MANKILWDAVATSRGTVLTTELDNLAAAAFSAAGTEIDNATNLDQYAWVEFDYDFADNPHAGDYVTLFMLKALDGTNYQGAGDGTNGPGAHAVVAAIPINFTADHAAHVAMSGVFRLPPCKIKFVLQNNGTRALAASGSVVELFTANDEVQ